MSNPRHVNPVQNASTADYNFVPLPEKVLFVDDGLLVGAEKVKLWETHDRYVPGTHSGWLDLKIWTESPLFIRGPVVKKKDGKWSDDGKKEARLRPEPSSTPDGLAMIPGSSLRGVLRSLYEILTFGKLQPVPETNLFFRSMAGNDDRIGSFYRERMERGGGKRAGRFHKTSRGYEVIPCKFVKVSRLSGIVAPFSYDSSINAPIQWDYHCKPCHFTLDQHGGVNAFHWGKSPADSYNEGIFVQTGAAGGQKLHEFIFYDEDRDAAISVPDELVERFNDDDQITQWQAKNFPTLRPERNARRQDGHLADRDPVFYLADDSLKSEDNPDGLIFFGRAGMFRLPYDKSPYDLLPENHRSPKLDMAEALFGRVRKKRKGDTEKPLNPQVKGRLFVDDAISESRWQDLTAAGRAEVYKTTLLSPHPTSYQHYLTQNGPAGAGELTTYLKDDETTLRGAKLFWHTHSGTALPSHRDNKGDPVFQRHGNGALGKTDSLLQPIFVPEEKAFTGRIQFHNLSPVELGALLEAVDLPAGCAHKLGMAKGKGLGSVRIKIEHVELLDLADRYKAYAPDRVEAPENTPPEAATRARAAFVERICAHAETSGEFMLEDEEGWRRIARLDALYLMLKMHENPPVTRTLRLNEFRRRRVLSTPHIAVGRPEPNWPQNPPRAAPPVFEEPEPPAPRPPGKPLQKGQRRNGPLFRAENGWICELMDKDQPLRGPVEIPAGMDIPNDTPDGAAAGFYVTYYKKNEFKARLEKPPILDVELD